MASAALLGMLRFLAPELVGWPDDDLNAALFLAEGYRPSRLPCRKADEAQCLYAAWLLSLRKAGNGDGTGVNPSAKDASLLKEGDLSVQYSEISAAQLSAADKGSYIARYRDLMRLNSRGAIMTRLSTDVLPPQCP